MRRSGLIEFGAHTHTHDHFLGRCDEFRRDLKLCMEVLRERFGTDRPAFAFPFGEASSELIDVVRELDLNCGLTTRFERVEPGEDSIGWGRFHVGTNDSPAVLAGRLSGWYAIGRLHYSQVRPSGTGSSAAIFGR